MSDDLDHDLSDVSDDLDHDLSDLSDHLDRDLSDLSVSSLFISTSSCILRARCSKTLGEVWFDWFSWGVLAGPRENINDVGFAVDPPYL